MIAIETRPHSHRWRGLRVTGKTLPDGTPEPGRPIIVNCHSHGTAGLCRVRADGDTSCADLFALVLADVPAIIDDLDISIAGESRFVEHGSRSGSVGATTKGSGNPAIAAQQRLATALDGAASWFDARSPEGIAILLARHLERLIDEPDLVKVARDVSQAVSRAHKVIDSPPDLLCYGPCPECSREIWQERIRKDDETTPVMCRFPSCGYAEPLDKHQRKQLEAAEDRWMTVTELVAAFESAGEVLPRHRIYNWFHRDGLPREERPVLRWADGGLKQVGKVDTFRVGDVRDMMIRAKLARNAS